jgi:hypothetical protein
MTAGIKANSDGSGAIQVGGSDVIGLGTTGNVNIPTSGARITGDFSNATVANRVMFQSSTTNGQTSIGVLPNGTSTFANLNLFGGTDPANASVAQYVNTGTEVILNATKTGTGSYLPMTFYTGGSERMQIDTSGNVGIGVTPLAALTIANSRGIAWPNAAGSYSVTAGADMFKFSDNNFYINNWDSGASIIFRRTSNAESMRIDGSGNVGIGTNAPGQRVTISDSTQSNQLGLTGSQQNAMQFLNASGGAGFIVGRSLSVNNANDFFIFDAVANANRLGIDASGNLQFNSGYGSAAIAYGCRAWVNFNGTTNTGGFCTIRASGNVTSVADNGTGLYTVNLTNAMPDANYAVVCGGDQQENFYTGQPSSASAVSVQSQDDAPAPQDSAVISIAIFR